MSFWSERLRGIDSALAPAYIGREALDDPRMRDRGFVTQDAGDGEL